MKTFCQNCGNPLAEKVLICPKCGFENKVFGKTANTSKTKFALYVLSVVIILGGFILFNKSIGNYYNQIKSLGISSVINGDIQNKNDFEKSFEKYKSAKNSFIDSNGLMSFKEHLSGIESYKKDDKNRLRMLNKNESAIVQNAQADLKQALYYCNADDESFKKCKEYKDFFDNNSSKKCETCSENISDLYKIVASFKNKDVANKLAKLVDSLRTQQSFYDSDEFINLPNLIFEKIYCTANQANIMIQGESSSEYLGMLNHLVKRESCLNEMSEFEKKFVLVNNQINENATAINDYISILNGDLGLNLSGFGAQ